MKRAALLLAALAGCATVPADDLVWIEVAGDNRCAVEAAGRSYALPDDSASLGEALRRLARRSGGALMSPRPVRASPGCWDEAMALVRAANFRRFGYFSTLPEVETC